MKRFIHIILILLVGSVVSCQKAPFLTFNGQKSLSFKDNGGTETITFSCNNAWTVSSSANWLKASPSQGDANEEGVRVTITCEANTTYDPRTGTVTIMSEGITETISVTQDTNYGLMSEPTTFNLTNAAQDIEVEVKANVEYTITIDDAGKDWISQAGTKALVAKKVRFGVSENPKYVGREASVTFKQKDGALSGTVKISQAQRDTLYLSSQKDSISWEGGTLKLDVIANVEYTIVAKDSPNWVKIGEGSKGETKDGLTTYSHIIEVAENESKARYAELTITDEKGEFSKSFLIAQGSDGFIEFEDDRFKAYCIERFDENRDGEISYKEAGNVTYISCSEKKISSLEGIQYFTSLTHLYCYGNKLTSLDVSGCKELIYLNCEINKLTSLDVNGCTELTGLNCSSNNLTSLDVNGCTELTNLYCYGNKLTSLDVSKCTELSLLSCSSNNLTSLDVSGCKELTGLGCDDNNLTSLDVSGCKELTGLGCDYNNLTSLDVSKCTELTDLKCRANNLSSLDVSKCTELTYLSCSNNKLTSLDVGGCTELTALYCSSNNLTSLDVSKCTELTYLYCFSNPNLFELWLKTGQTIGELSKDYQTVIKYKD